MAPPPPSIDAVTVAIAIAALLFGNNLAIYVGPYAVIFLTALAGAAWSASRRVAVTRLNTLGYIAFMILVAMLVTVSASELLAEYAGIRTHVLLIPVAAVITGIGPDWPAVLAWAAGLVRSTAEQLVLRWVQERKPAEKEKDHE